MSPAASGLASAIVAALIGVPLALACLAVIALLIADLRRSWRNASRVIEDPFGECDDDGRGTCANCAPEIEVEGGFECQVCNGVARRSDWTLRCTCPEQCQSPACTGDHTAYLDAIFRETEEIAGRWDGTNDA